MTAQLRGRLARLERVVHDLPSCVTTLEIQQARQMVEAMPEGTTRQQAARLRATIELERQLGRVPRLPPDLAERLDAAVARVRLHPAPRPAAPTPAGVGVTVGPIPPMFQPVPPPLGPPAPCPFCPPPRVLWLRGGETQPAPDECETCGREIPFEVRVRPKRAWE